VGGPHIDNLARNRLRIDISPFPEFPAGDGLRQKELGDINIECNETNGVIHSKRIKTDRLISH
jgi:hypothetical protein